MTVQRIETSPVIDDMIDRLHTTNAKLQEENAKLKKDIVELKKRILKLEAKPHRKRRSIKR